MFHRVLLLTFAFLAAGPAGAAEPKLPQGSPIISGVTACQAVTDPQQRLACYDSAVSKLKAATDQRDVVVIDKEQLRKTRRSLFGFSLPDLPSIFGGGDDDDDEKDAPEFQTLESRIANVRSIMPGKWTMVLSDGAVWQFSEIDRNVEPERGNTILIKRGPLGNFMANIDGQRAVRVERIR